MKHIFKSNPENPELCCFMVMDRSVCARNTQDHTDKATCEECGSSGNCDFYLEDTETLRCEGCLQKHREAIIKRGGTDLDKMKQNMNAQELITLSQKIDTSIQVREDIFNAKTIAIKELKDKIDKDDSVKSEDKHITLAKVIADRFNHLTEVVIKDARDTINAALNEQRAIQSYWQEFQKKLKDSEREQIKLKDINYKPLAPPKKVSAPTVKKYDRTSIRLLLMKHREAVPESKITEEMLTIICMTRDIKPEDALQELKRAGM